MPRYTGVFDTQCHTKDNVTCVKIYMLKGNNIYITVI